MGKENITKFPVHPNNPLPSLLIYIDKFMIYLDYIISLFLRMVYTFPTKII